MSFDLMQLDPRLRENIRTLGFHVPTPIQRKAIPAVLEGRDVVGLAQTGTGKTAAFGIPLLQRLTTGPRHQLRVLIVGPTRELAEQTFNALNDLGAHTDLRCVTIYGGVGMQPQVAGLRHGAEIAIACPGRLLDHIRQGTIRLAHVECLVLDEADRMFDMGFLPDVRRIMEKLPAQRQTLLFSATMPEAIKKLAHEVLRDPVTFQIAHSRPAESVSHALYPVVQHLKAPLLLAILDRTDRESVLVFTRTKHRAKRLAAQLSRAGHSATCLQGNLSQRQRQTAMDGFRSGRYQVLVATDLAARGIDVSTISHVINFDMPGSVDDYTHRIGRTGRAAKTGDAFTLMTAEDEGVVRGIERVLGSRIERRTLDGFDYGARPPPSTHHPEHRHAGAHHAAHRPAQHSGQHPAHRPAQPHAPPSGGHVRSFGRVRRRRR
ncbi:MAG: DEAD/DEAH box helicase [Verrucomicrobiota bacterium]